MRRGLLLALLAIGVALAVAALRPGDDLRPVAVVGHTGITLPPSSTTPPPTAASQPASSTTTKPPAVVVANRSSTVVRSDGVTVVNEGSAVASTGGNTVIGAPNGASVMNGPVSAVGNASEVRITPP